MHSGGVTPICTLMDEPERPVDSKCRRRSGEATRCEPLKSWFIQPSVALRPQSNA